MKICCLSATAMLLFGSTLTVFAENTESTTYRTEEPIVITATRTAQTANESLASVTVITRENILRQQAQSVQDILRGVPGIRIANSGGAGKTTSVFLRGTESDHVLVLIDGIKVGSATLGTTAFQDIPVEQIERIEIVRGPRSSLYGSEAIGGVIQIFTRKGGGSFKPSLSVGAGNYSTLNASGGVSGGGERGWFSVSASGINTKGFNACDGKPFPDGAGCFTNEPDRDGYRNVSSSLRGGYRFDNSIEMDVHALRARSDSNFDGGFQNESESFQQVIGSRIRFSLADILHLKLTVGHILDESDNFKDNVFQSRFNTKRETISVQNDFRIGKRQLLTMGFDYQDDRVDSILSYAVTSRDNKGFFAQYQGSLNAIDIQFSARQDDNEQFDERTTGGLDMGYTFNKSLRLTASYATAFKAPTFNELYFPGFGNSNLKPEKSLSIEFGLSNKTGWMRWLVNAYETRVDNLIVYDNSIFAPANIGQAVIRGIEIILNTRVLGWVLNTSYTPLNPENRSSDTDRGNVLQRRAKQSLQFEADRQFGKFKLGMTLFAEGKRYDDLANTRKLGGYTTVDLRTDFTISKNLRLQARIENLFDKDYETAAFFNQPGRSLFLTLRYHRS